jgi:multidrug efflux pump subunit AcrB/outer membrane protein TolC
MVRLLVQHATTVVVATLCVLLFGVFSYIEMPREASPDVKIPVVLITTPYVGVSPEDVEGLVTIPIENELASLNDVKKMTSSSAEGISIISMEFEPGVDIDEALQKVRDRVNRARPKMPDDIEEPSVGEVSFSDIPVLLVTLAGGVDEQGLKRIAEDLQEEIERLPGVLDADVSGGREREIHVEIYPERLAFYGLKLGDVTNAIAGENVNIPGGNVTVGSGTFLLRTPGEFTEAAQLERVAVKRVGDRPVYISDLGRVHDGFEERSTYSRMNGEDSVTLSVKKRAGANILTLSEDVRELVSERAEAFPAGVRVRFLGDQSTGVRNMVSELQNNIITALILVVAVLLVFMGARNSLFVAVAIPMSMLASVLVLDAFGFTLNMVVLFSLILALGMLVDNAIVVVENVYRHAEDGLSLKDAAVVGTNEVAMAVAASTATTVAAFFPMVFWGGVMGQFMGYLPKTVITVLVASLVVAVTILPVLTSRLMNKPKDDAGEAETAAPIDPDTLGPVMRRYYDALDLAVRFRYLVAIGGAALLGLSMFIYGQFNYGVEFFPATDPERATVSVRLPEGADLDATDKVVRSIEEVLAQVENVDVFVSEVGVSGGSNPLAGASASANAARITVDFLKPLEQAEEGEKVRVESTRITMLKMRAAFSNVPGADISITEQEMGPPVGAPIGIEVSGDDFHDVGNAANALMREIAKIEGTTELDNDYRVGRPELRLRVDRGAATRVGVSTQGIGSAVRGAVAGTVASKLRNGEEEYDILVRVAPEYQQDLQQILSLRLPGREDTSPNTFPVPLSAVAGYELAGGTGTIKHIDQNLVVTIEGDVTTPEVENAVREEIAAFLAAWEAPPGIHARVGGANDEQQEAQAFITWALGLAIALIFMVLVTQFDSVAVPGIIVFTVALSLIGVLWGLLITGTAFGIIMTGIGVISLAGVVVNNAIVLLDYVQQLEDKGLDGFQAILRAGITRFRPVMLTAITTTLGLVPMAIGASVDFVNFRLITGSASAQFWGPMAVAVIFGLTFATVLTLIIVPTLYGILLDMRNAVTRRPTPPMAEAALVLLVLGLAVPQQAHAVTLEEAYAAAEGHSVDLMLVREQTAQARTLPWQALSAVMPRVSASANYVINQTEVELDFADSIPEDFRALLGDADFGDPIVVQPKNAWSGNLNLYVPILNGQAFPGWTAAKRIAKAAEADERQIRQQIRAGVARAFYGLATARTAVSVSEQAVTIARHQLDLAKRRFDAGLADRREVLQGELGVSRAERDLRRAEEQLVAAEEGFSRVTGLESTVALTMPPPVRLPESVEDLVLGTVSRGDIEAGEHRIAAARNERIARDLEWAPSVDFTFTEIYNQIPGFVPENFQWRIGFNFKWDIFDGGLRIARSRELASKVRQAELAHRQLREQAEESVKVTWEAAARASMSLEAAEEELTLAKENLELSERAYNAGSATWLDLELARLSLVSTELTVATERMNRELAAIDLLVAAGAL